MGKLLIGMERCPRALLKRESYPHPRLAKGSPSACRDLVTGRE